MKYIFSFFERKSFIKVFSFCLISFLFLTGFTYSQDKTDVSTIKLFIQETEEHTIHIFPPKKVRLIYADERMEILTYEHRVKDVLSLYDLDYCDTNDIITPELEDNIIGNTLIKVILVEKSLTKNTKIIPHENLRIKDPDLTLGKEILVQEGQEGIKEILYEEIYENDELIEIKLHGEKIISKPTNEIIKVGTKTSATGRRDCKHWFNVVDNSTNDSNERDILKHLIKCESGCNDGANNNNRYLGLLQFNKNTFSHYGGEDIWNGKQQILAALKIIRSGGLTHHWPKCSQNI